MPLTLRKKKKNRKEKANPKDNVVCESRSPWILSSLPSFTKGSRVVVISPTITSIIYGNETKRGVLCILLLIRAQLLIRDRLDVKSADSMLKTSSAARTDAR